ncbi:MAG TPA: DUF3300 domain-containing protein [Candidatus Saccharimonadales bacterium]|nr:DUF3300 domain-containing protein [Candidatus Saccharimonadales bacterium]
MNRLKQYLSWVTSIALILSTTALDACGSNKSAPMAVANTAQQDAQNPPPAQGQQDQTQGQAPAQAQNASADSSQTQLPAVNLTADGLDELMAPIALYPDPVLAVMLQASVNPQEVMDAGNWLALDENNKLTGAALDQASQKAGFTPVAQALLHYPTVVDLMCTQFDWTKQMGAAYSANPKAVLDSVQRLRAQAVDNGALKSGPQMKVDVTQDQGQQVVKLEPTDPKTVYVPSYDPSRVYTTTTTTTSPNGTTTSTTTTNAPAGSTSTSTSSTNTTVVQEKSGVSTGTAVLIGLLSFGAGVAVGAAINNNNYYYPSWGYGGVWYGPRPYYPPPYHPVYYGGWHGGYYYNRPPYYHQTNIYINNSNNYYNRFNNNGNLNPNYKPRPVPYNNNPNGVYAKSMGNRPATRQQGVTYQPRPNNPNAGARPAPGTGNVQGRPGQGNANAGARPATGALNDQNFRGQSSYHPRNPSTGQQPVGGAQTRPAPGNANAGNRVGGANPPARNPSGDRGFGQPGGTRPTTENQQYNRPSTGNAQARPSPGNQPANRPSTGNQPATRPSTANQPAARPAPQPSNRPQSGGAFNGASSAKADRAASNRGHTSMGGGTKAPQAQAPAARKR